MHKYQEILKDFAERMKNIYTFAPILELGQKTKYPYSLPALAIAVMLFILEDMIRLEKNCTYENIAYFIQDLINSYYGDQVSYQEALEITYYLVRDGLMNQGRSFRYEFPDWEENKESSHWFNLVELEDYNIQEKVVRLRLSTDGLELLFKTKEMYNELQVSITQLYLRQQIQKGVFDGALRSVEELALGVRNERQKIRQLEERIIRDVLQVAKENELEKQLSRIDEQLQREQELFDDLAELVQQTLNEYQGKTLTEKEDKALRAVTLIRRKLYDVISDHESLFKDKMRLHHLMINSIEEMIFTSFATKVNFDTEFLRPVVTKDLDINIIKKILDPIIPLKRKPQFHPGRIFLEQPLKKQGEDNSEQELWELEEERLRAEEVALQEARAEKESYLELYIMLVLKPLVEKTEHRIGDTLRELQNTDPNLFTEITARMDFYSFMVQLHQLGRIPLLTEDQVDTLVLDDLPLVLVKLVSKDPQIYAFGAFEVVATEDIVRLPTGYVMTDFLVRRSV